MSLKFCTKISTLSLSENLDVLMKNVYSEAVVRRCSIKKAFLKFLKILQNWQETSVPRVVPLVRFGRKDISWTCKEKASKFELRFLVIIDFSNCLTRKIIVIVIIVTLYFTALCQQLFMKNIWIAVFLSKEKRVNFERLVFTLDVISWGLFFPRVLWNISPGENWVQDFSIHFAML